MKKIIMLLLLATACTRSIPPETSCNFLMSSNQQRITWGTNNLPITLYIDSSVPPSYVPVIEAAAATWNESSTLAIGKSLFKIETSNPSTNNTIYFMTSWPAGWTTNEEAMTRDSFSGDSMYQTNVYIDAQNFQFDVTNSGNPNLVNLESLMIHELGHTVGLMHDLNVQSVMYPSLAFGQIRDTIDQVNINSIACGY